MLNRLQAIYQSIKAAKARSNALVEEGRLITGWRGAIKKRQAYRPTPSLEANSY
jgi:hypothetical protein